MSHPSLNKLKTAPSAQPPATTTTTKLTLYVGFFALGFIIASALFMMILSKFTLNAQLVTGLSIAIGAYVAVYKFTKHQRRALTTKEINRLTLSSIAIVWLLTALYFLCLWLLVFDTASREVLLEMSRQQSLPLLMALAVMAARELARDKDGALPNRR